MVRQLRGKNGSPRHGLVLANGGVLSYQHVVCLASKPRKDGTPYPRQNPLPELISDVITPPVDVQAEGLATIEVSLYRPNTTFALLCRLYSMTNLVHLGQTYTVEFNRDGSPDRGYIVGRLNSTGHRFIANHADENTLKQLSSDAEEQVGRAGYVRRDPQEEARSIFTFERAGKL